MDMGAGTYSVLIVRDSPFASRHPWASISHKRLNYATLRDFRKIPGTALRGRNPGLHSSAAPSVASLRSQNTYWGGKPSVPSKYNHSAYPGFTNAWTDLRVGCHINVKTL